MSFLTYLFRSNPGNLTYGSPYAVAVITACVALVVASFALRQWKKGSASAMVRKLGGVWANAAFWFGISGLLLIICRIERIQIIAMRFWWVVWVVLAALFLFAQWKIFRARHYQVLPRMMHSDPRDAYIPGRKRR